MSALVGRPWGPCDGHPGAVDREVRRALVATDLLPAMQRAVRAFRWTAAEYDDEGDEPPDPDRQDAPAMRPALAALDDRQRTALDRLLDGFDTEAGLVAWARVVIESSYAEIDAATLRPLYFELPLRERLLAPTELGDRFVREAWALRYLLRACKAAARVAGRSCWRCWCACAPVGRRGDPATPRRRSRLTRPADGRRGTTNPS